MRLFYLLLFVIFLVSVFLLKQVSLEHPVFATPFDDAVPCGSGDNHGRCNDSMQCHGDWECNSGRCVNGVCRGTPGGDSPGASTCDANAWGSWSACFATCGGGTQYRTNACGTSASQACNTGPCPTPTPTPTPDLRFPFRFMGIKVGALPSAQNKSIFVQAYIDPKCYKDKQVSGLDISRQQVSVACPFLYNPDNPANPLAGFNDFYSFYGKIAGNISTFYSYILSGSLTTLGITGR